VSFLANPWVLLGIAGTWLASLVAVGFWQHDAGATARDAYWQARDNEALVAANTTIERLNNEARETERARALQLFRIGENHAAEKDAAERRRRDDVANARSGALKLRVAGACPARSGDGAAAASAAPAGGGDGSTTAELPGEVTAALLDLANDADQVVRQLTACQATVLTYLDPKGASP
jgi:prophage endopeptidase